MEIPQNKENIQQMPIKDYIKRNYVSKFEIKKIITAPADLTFKERLDMIMELLEVE